MQFDSRRATCPGYLEFIWRADVPRDPGVNPQAIALITEMVDGTFHGFYRLHTVVAPTVSACKAELFSLIEAGQ
jgi:hypothetical protein